MVGAERIIGCRLAVRPEAGKQDAVIAAVGGGAADIFDPHAGRALLPEAEGRCGPLGHVDDPVAVERPAVVDAHDHGVTVLQVRDPGIARKRHGRVGGRDRIAVEDFAVGRHAAVEAGSVPGRQSLVRARRFAGDIGPARDRIGLADHFAAAALRNGLAVGNDLAGSARRRIWDRCRRGHSTSNWRLSARSPSRLQCEGEPDGSRRRSLPCARMSLLRDYNACPLAFVYLHPCIASSRGLPRASSQGASMSLKGRLNRRACQWQSCRKVNVVTKTAKSFVFSRIEGCARISLEQIRNWKLGSEKAAEEVSWAPSSG